jgi:hypothetical protein
MPTITTPLDFINRFINNCLIVKSSRLDKTIKAIINTYNKSNRKELRDYLNKIRIVYYLSRLEYKDSKRAKAYKGI